MYKSVHFAFCWLLHSDTKNLPRGLDREGTGIQKYGDKSLVKGQLGRSRRK